MFFHPSCPPPPPHLVLGWPKQQCLINLSDEPKRKSLCGIKKSVSKARSCIPHTRVPDPFQIQRIRMCFSPPGARSRSVLTHRDPAPDPDPSISKQKKIKKHLDFCGVVQDPDPDPYQNATVPEHYRIPSVFDIFSVN
jgi:hypothetical protein